MMHFFALIDQFSAHTHISISDLLELARNQIIILDGKGANAVQWVSTNLLTLNHFADSWIILKRKK